MSEYDIQFQADLEKAQALSLESLALEQFRRQKLASSGNWRNFVYLLWYDDPIKVSQIPVN